MKIAIIGSGISGLSSAYMLSQQHHVDMFEKENRVGGHSHTIEVTDNNQSLPIDTGFIVFNDRTYPNFIKLLKSLKTPYQCTRMSFSVHDLDANICYSGSSLSGLFAQKKNLLKPRYWRMLIDILRFNRIAKRNIKQQKILKDFIADLHFGSLFYSTYLRPMCSAIWSCNPTHIDNMPCCFVFAFFNNHGLLDITSRPQWYTVTNGSQQYTQAIAKKITGKIRVNEPVTTINRNDTGVELTTENGTFKYDKVIIACHADQALNMINDPSNEENNTLNAFEYQENETFLHTSTCPLPSIQQTWSCWNVQQQHHQTSFTYHMNQLQHLPSKTNYCVTLNPIKPIPQSQIIKKLHYRHPLFSLASQKAQRAHDIINGHKHCYYVGAYWGNGFHEDGVVSAIKAVSMIDKTCIL
jgi:uncharacterized protein